MLCVYQSPISKYLNETKVITRKINNEVEMIFAFQQGQEMGFDFIFHKFFPSLCFFANHILDNKCEAEDIASSAFIKIWKRHSQFNDAKNIRSYLYQIVRNDCFSFLQQKNRSAKVQKEIEYLTMVNFEDNYESNIIRAEFYAELYLTINSLPKECRKIFTLLYVHGKTVKEISKELNLSPSTIKTQKSRGLIILRKKIVPLSIVLFLFPLFYFF
ncbi:MAG TPA: RNA polymerase sigma-70 factor [Hanamia sp.]|nr:RNA polymerase sigma-70 factor [Hanamia sp.]